MADPTPAEAEREAVVSPAAEIELFRPGRDPALPLVVGETLYFSEVRNGDADGCSGRDVWKVSLAADAGRARETRVAEVPCVVRLFTDGTRGYVHVRSETSPPTDELKRLPEGDERGLEPAFPSVLGARGQGLYRARLAWLYETQSIAARTPSRRTFALVGSSLFALLEVGAAESSKTFLDRFDVRSGLATAPEMAELTNRWRLRDWVAREDGTVCAAIEGASDGMARLVTGRHSGTHGTIQGLRTIGSQEAPLPEWTALAERSFGVRRPRYLTALSHGFVGVDRTPYSFEVRSVFYFADTDRRFHKVAPLSLPSVDVTGISAHRGGLVVADGSGRRLRWYGAASPFPERFPVRRLTND